MTSASLIEKCCLIANPVAENPTHYMVEHALAEQGLDWRFMTFEVDPARLGDAMRGVRALGIRGVKIGDPFQTAAQEHLDDLTERARRAGSVNMVTGDGQRLVGDNTEGTALAALANGKTKLAGQRVVVLGAGRLAHVFAASLVDQGPSEIVIACRSEEAGQRLIGQLAEQLAERPAENPAAPITWAPLEDQPLVLEESTALLVNATSLGMDEPDTQLPVEVESFAPTLVVADVAYNTAHTWLTRQARDRGCPVIDGLTLYAEQTALALEAWTGIAPDRTTMHETAEEFLGI